MKKKKKKIFTHIFLWIIIAIILFPISWVVMTSLRRDNAAFSPHIFSTNLTLQNYKDLLFPPDNIPALISDLNNAISYTPPYNKRDPKDVERTIEEKLKKLKVRIDESAKMMGESYETFLKVKEKLKRDVFPNWIEDMHTTLKNI